MMEFDLKGQATSILFSGKFGEIDGVNHALNNAMLHVINSLTTQLNWI